MTGGDRAHTGQRSCINFQGRTRQTLEHHYEALGGKLELKGRA